MSDDPYLPRDNRGPDTSHVRAAHLATRQHGPVRHDQLRALGLSEHQIAYAVRSGRFHVVYPRVYVIGSHDLSELGSLSAAVLACGDVACLSCRSAAQIRGI